MDVSSRLRIYNKKMTTVQYILLILTALMSLPLLSASPLASNPSNLLSTELAAKVDLMRARKTVFKSFLEDKLNVNLAQHITDLVQLPPSTPRIKLKDYARKDITVFNTNYADVEVVRFKNLNGTILSIINHSRQPSTRSGDHGETWQSEWRIVQTKGQTLFAEKEDYWADFRKCFGKR